jgi:hypothetical protein
MILKCCRCGDTFPADKETVELISEGYISSGDVEQRAECDDCRGYSYEAGDNQHSDADPGL